MICTNCEDPLIAVGLDFGCPNGCISISHDDYGEMIFYNISIAKWSPKAYVLISSKENKETTLQILDLTRTLKQIQESKAIMPVIVHLDCFFPFNEQSQEELDKLVPRLLKLQVFS
jgi:hypothetical protein